MFDIAQVEIYACTDEDFVSLDILWMVFVYQQDYYTCNDRTSILDVIMVHSVGVCDL